MSESNSDSDLGDNDELSLPNRRGRNIDHPKDHPKQGERFKVEWEPTHIQPTGHLRKKFNATINRVAKMHTIFPLNVNWPKQTSQSFRQAIEYIEVDFDLDGYSNAHQYIKFELNNTWRRYRNYIKEKYFDPFVDDESTERMYACLHLYIDRFTFEKCVEELWTIEEFKRKSKINKTNRTKKILNHKTGSIPFSAIRENLQREDIETSRINVLIRSSGTDNEVIVIQQKCISKFIQSKKGRHIRLGGGSFAESSTTSTRFSNEMNARFLEKEKGKKKEKMNDQMVMLLQDNQVLKMKHDEIVEMFEDMKKTFISQSNTTPQPSDRGSLQDKSNAGQSDQRYQTPPFK